MLLLTGATGTVGRALLARLPAGTRVRCLVRDADRLRATRTEAELEVVRGDLGDVASFPAAVQGVRTIVHLAAPLRDQPAGTVEALTTGATEALIAAAEAAGVRRFVLFSILGATADSPARLLRAKVAAEQALIASALEPTVFAPAWIYDHGDPFMEITRRFSRLPVMPVSGSGAARFEPIWARDVAECIVAALPEGPAGAAAAGARYELAGPEVLSYAEIVRTVLAAWGRPRPLVHLPLVVMRGGLRLLGPLAPASWEEVQLLELTLLSERGTADVESLGVRPRRMTEVLHHGPDRTA